MRTIRSTAKTLTDHEVHALPVATGRAERDLRDHVLLLLAVSTPTEQAGKKRKSVGRLGIEPRTYGLKEHGDHEQLHTVNPNLILRGSFMARQVLQLAARRDPEILDVAQRLAAIVLGSDEVRLAQNVARSGPFAVVHAVELAEFVLARSTEAVRPHIAETK